MSWETPKTNWTADDYYNLEDAQRIAGNICHLFDMALQIYGRTSITCLVRRETHFNYDVTPVAWVQFFGIWNLGSWYGTQPVSPSAYTRDLTYWLDKDATNLLILTRLKAMSVKSAPIYVSNYWVDYAINSKTNTGSKFYSGLCIPDDEGYYSHIYSDPPIISIWGNWYSADKNTIPLSSNWSQNSSMQCAVSLQTNASALMNKSFYPYQTLNKIEQVIQAVYGKFTSYL